MGFFSLLFVCSLFPVKMINCMLIIYRGLSALLQEFDNILRRITAKFSLDQAKI